MGIKRDPSALILGCGASGGVPLAIGHPGGFWGLCDAKNPKNRRTRCSVMIHYGGRYFLIDTSPDLRAQFLDHGIQDLDGILYTHAHADHINGIDDVRPFYFAKGKKPIPIYGDSQVLKTLQSSFPYLFKQGDLEIYPKILSPFPLGEGEQEVQGVRFVTFFQEHGPQKSLGFRFGDFAYSTDFKELSPTALKALEGVKIWVVDCVSREEKPTHCHLEKALFWIHQVNPEKAYLTHMNHTLDYETLKAELPSFIEPAYDGLRIIF